MHNNETEEKVKIREKTPLKVARRKGGMLHVRKTGM
jgi:hypothetical protein